MTAETTLHPDSPPLYVPAGEELADTWERLALLHINGEEDDDLIDVALAALAWWLPPQEGWRRFENLRDALERVSEAEDPNFDVTTLQPDWQNAEIYRNYCCGLAKGAIDGLTGRRS